MSNYSTMNSSPSASQEYMNLEEDFDIYIISLKDRKRRTLASTLASHGQGQWSDKDIELLLEELEIEVGEGTNRFLYEDERKSYCMYLSQSLKFDVLKSPEQIYDKIIWLWSTWEAISRATGKSWWNISEHDKHELSLMLEDKGK